MCVYELALLHASSPCVRLRMNNSRVSFGTTYACFHERPKPRLVRGWRQELIPPSCTTAAPSSRSPAAMLESSVVLWHSEHVGAQSADIMRRNKAWAIECVRCIVGQRLSGLTLGGVCNDRAHAAALVGHGQLTAWSKRTETYV
jgi:hypothetical protein